MSGLRRSCFAGSEEGQAVSEPELRMMLLNAKQSGAVELYEKDMIEGVLDLDQATVEQIMQPRVEVRSMQDLRASSRQHGSASSQLIGGTCQSKTKKDLLPPCVAYAILVLEILRCPSTSPKPIHTGRAAIPPTPG